MFLETIVSEVNILVVLDIKSERSRACSQIAIEVEEDLTSVDKSPDSDVKLPFFVE